MRLGKFADGEIDKRKPLEVRVAAIVKHLGLDKQITACAATVSFVTILGTVITKMLADQRMSGVGKCGRATDIDWVEVVESGDKLVDQPRILRHAA